MTNIDTDTLLWNLANVYEYGDCEDPMVGELLRHGLVQATETGLALTRKGDDLLFTGEWLVQKRVDRKATPL